MVHLSPLVLFATLKTTTALVCLQCNGWQGDYPLRSTTLNQCDNLNNQCKTDYYCVKITDPMRAGVSYSIYKADCWSQDTLSVTPTNTTNVVSGACYDYEDPSIPPKRFKYCFCNTNYCNTVGLLPKFIAFAVPILTVLLI